VAASRDMIAQIESELADWLATRRLCRQPVQGRVSRRVKHFPCTEVRIVPDEKGSTTPCRSPRETGPACSMPSRWSQPLRGQPAHAKIASSASALRTCSSCRRRTRQSEDGAATRTDLLKALQA